MSLQIHFFNLWAMLVCVVLNMIIGALWYSPVLFGKTWLKLIGKKQEDISKESGNKAMMLALIPALVSTVLLALALALVNAATIADALIVGSLVSAGFIGMSVLNLVLFEGRSLTLGILNTGYAFVSMNISAIILVLWR